jgi:hypothetical protein
MVNKVLCAGRNYQLAFWKLSNLLGEMGNAIVKRRCVEVFPFERKLYTGRRRIVES